jgi:hypothetical protein
MAPVKEPFVSAVMMVVVVVVVVVVVHSPSLCGYRQGKSDGGQSC